MIVGELKVFISEQFKRINGRFDWIESRLDNADSSLKKLDDDIRGNGQDVLNFRIDCLEKIKNWSLAIFAILATAVLGAFFVHHFLFIKDRRKTGLSD